MMREGTNWHEFCTRLLQTEAFRQIYTRNLNMGPFIQVAERTAIGTFREILHPDFDESLRNKCLDESGKLCCELFLKYARLDTDTDIDTFIANLMDVSVGRRWLERKGDVVFDEYLRGNGSRPIHERCRCRIIRSGQVEPTSLMCICAAYCEKAIFETVVKRPVQVELLDSVLCTGSDTCRWLIHIE